MQDMVEGGDDELHVQPIPPLQEDESSENTANCAEARHFNTAKQKASCSKRPPIGGAANRAVS